MVLAREMKEETYLASPSYPVQWLLWSIFAPVGRLLGRRATYDRCMRRDFWEDAAEDLEGAVRG